MEVMTGGRLCKAKERGGHLTEAAGCVKNRKSHTRIPEKASVVNNWWCKLGRHLDLRRSRDPRESYQIVVVFPDV